MTNQPSTAENQFEKMMNESQFSLTGIPFHVHNGSDSNQVPAQFLDFTNFAIWGSIISNGGDNIITNTNILTTSTILVSGTLPYAFALVGKIEQNGEAIVSDVPGGDTVYYLIIF